MIRLCIAAVVAVVVPAIWTAGRVTAAEVARSLSCRSNVVSSVHLASNVDQLMIVTSERHVSSYATFTAWQRSGTCFRPVFGPWRARVGRSGISTSHHEGDGSTPVGNFAIGATIYGVGADPGVHLGFHRLACGDWWDEDPASGSYNRFVHLACGVTPRFGGGSEALWREVTAYRYFAVIEYNTAPVVPGLGSGIFLHVDTGAPTIGCVSLPATNLVTVLRWLLPSARARIAIGTRDELASMSAS